MDLVDVANTYPVWLWHEQGGIRLWTPDETCLFVPVAPRLAGIDTLRGARDSQQQITLANAFEPEAFGKTLARLFAVPGRRCLLHLASRRCEIGDVTDRPDWRLQSVQFEWLYLEGRPLAERIVVARHVSLEVDVLPPTPKGIVHLLDFWKTPNASVHPLDGILDTGGGKSDSIRITRGPNAAAHLVRSTDPANYAALVYFGHGSEDVAPDSAPLMDANREHAWTLPADNGLPALVILLACGTDCGNLVEYARQLLEQGATTVLAPYGRLDAPDSRRFLDVFLAHWFKGETVSAALAQAQLIDERARGARRLTIVGSPSLRYSDAPLLAELNDKELVSVCETGTVPEQREAAALLANRQTLRSFIGEGKLTNAVPRLLGLLHREAIDERGRWLFELYDQVPESRLGRLTRIWLFALQAIGAERFNHTRIAHYEKSRERRSDTADWVPAHVHYFWSRVHYRSGRYVASLGEIQRALALLPRDVVSAEIAPLARHVVNIFVDIDMPQAALTVADALIDYLDHVCEPALVSETIAKNMSWDGWDATLQQTEIKLERHFLLDSRARAQLRAGKNRWKLAAQGFSEKRKIAVREWRHDGHRELAWSLYTTAWGDDPKSANAAALAHEICELLAPGEGEAQVLTAKGSDTPPYLMRALSVWAWRAQDSTAVALLSQTYLGCFQALSADPAILAFVVAYLTLYQRDTSDSVPNLPDWSLYRSGLEKDGYFLEIAAFDALMGNRADAQRALQRHQRRLRDLPDILPSIAATFGDAGFWEAGEGVADEWLEEASARSALEAEILLSETIPSWAELLESGLLPL